MSWDCSDQPLRQPSLNFYCILLLILQERNQSPTVPQKASYPFRFWFPIPCLDRRYHRERKLGDKSYAITPKTHSYTAFHLNVLSSLCYPTSDQCTNKTNILEAELERVESDGQLHEDVVYWVFFLREWSCGLLCFRGAFLSFIPFLVAIFSLKYSMAP